MGSSKRGPFGGRRIVPKTLTVPNHDSFFVVKRVSEKNENFNSVSPFLVQRAFTATVGEVSSIRKMRSGDLLVEVNSKKQAQQILKLKALATIPVTVSPHTSLNYSKGVITCGELFNVPLEEISAELKHQGVTNVQQISIRRDGQILPTKHYILTFHSPTLPEFIYAGYIKLPVRHYIPNPLRCFQCQRFGHSKANCRGTLTCARCAEKGHDMKIKEALSYPEARKKILSQTPTPGLSYASAVQKSFCVNCTCQNCLKNPSHSKTNTKTSDSDSGSNTNTTLEIRRPEKALRKSKSQNSLKLKLSKRGLSKTSLPSKLKLSKGQKSVALGLATQSIVHKDLTSIFGEAPKSPELIALHPSEEEDEEMSCDVSQHSNTVSNTFKTKRTS
ncbi:uncharacterized protein LOC129966231 [Argiope bruennichi]|uniref:uncharacterized protein LOC129966231 n=1 Tax=Argiope bruennichi TaxID=94029 RepID=UPI00249533B2|nr:uncharacterized protein LOC129966231 [Argiope bruennichi]